MKSGIYKITNVVIGKIYVGSSYDLEFRKRRHFCQLKNGSHDNKKLLIDFIKYGKESFSFEIIEECPAEKLIEREQYYIDLLDVVNTGYNICPQAFTTRGVKRSEEFKRKVSASLMGHPGSNKGKKFSEEHRRKISESNKGRKQKPITEETKKKLSLANKGKKPWNTGKHLSEEHRKKISDEHKTSNCTPSFKGKHLSVEHRKKISQTLLSKGIKRTDEHKEILSKRMKGRKMSPESIEKMRLTKIGKPSWNKGLKMSPQLCKKLSEAHRGIPGHPWTEETKAKMRATLSKKKQKRLAEASNE